MRVWRTNNAAPPGRCPAPTQDIALNTRNRDHAIRDFDYGPPNPSAPSTWFWRKLAARWRMPWNRRTEREIKGMRCGNCAVFDISPAMQACLPRVGTLDAYDQAVSLSGSVLGYCWAHDFKCASMRTCATWAHGGPIDTNERSPLSKGG